jgi:hypothetical protein
MDTNPQPGAIELIRLADLTQSISVRLRSTEPAFETSGRRYYDADAIVTSGFVNGTVYLGFDSEDLTDLGQLLDAVEEAEQEAGLGEPFTADWPQSGRRPCGFSGDERRLCLSVVLLSEHGTWEGECRRARRSARPGTDERTQSAGRTAARFMARNPGRARRASRRQR